MLDISNVGSGADDVMNCAFPLTTRRRLWLETLDRDATPLLAHLADLRSQRLGLYFESLWHFFLAQDDAVDLVAHNLPVRQEGRTLGEFDILYFCRRRNCHVHLELAVKFYLGRASGEGRGGAKAWRHWLGPDARDRLDIKMERMLGHQIRLGATPAAQPLLASLGVEQLAREIEIKGYLFRPLFSDLAPPPVLNRNQRFHPWLPLTALAEAPREIIADGYQVLPRAHWLSAAHLSPAQSLLSLSELEQVLKGEMNQRPGPRLVAALDRNGDEIERFFVTSADWPGPSIPAANP